MTATRVSYVCQNSEGLFVGTRRFSYGKGTHAPFVTFEFARIFNRKADAEKTGYEVIPVTITLGELTR